MEKTTDSMGKLTPGDKLVSSQEDHKISFPGLPRVASLTQALENKG